MRHPPIFIFLAIFSHAIKFFSQNCLVWATGKKHLISDGGGAHCAHTINLIQERREGEEGRETGIRDKEGGREGRNRVRDLVFA